MGNRAVPGKMRQVRHMDAGREARGGMGYIVMKVDDTRKGGRIKKRH